MKPHLVQRLSEPMKTPLEIARERPWTKGPSYWTAERIAELAARNKVLRELRDKS